MKTVLYILVLFFIGTWVYNLLSIDFRMGLTVEQNSPYLIGFCAGLCGFVLTLILLRYQLFKEKVKKK